MIIDNVTFLNLDDFYDYACKTVNDDSFVGKMFGNNLQFVLNNTCITFFINGISEYEYIIMKMISSDISKFSRYDKICYTDLVNTNFPELQNDVSDVINVFNDFNVDVSRYYLPSGCIPGKCVVKLTGIQLVNLMKSNPTRFFSEMTDGKCIKSENNRIYLLPEYKDKLIDDDEFSNKVIEAFLNYFYNALRTKILYIDLMSDSIGFNILNTYSKPNHANLYSVRDYGFDINFLEDDKSQIMETLRYNKENRIGELSLDDLKLQFVINSSFGSYFDLFNLLPNRCFVLSESIVIPNKSNKTENIPISESLKNYSARIKSKEIKLLNDINNNYSTSERLLQYSELTPNFARYKYSVLVSLTDINNFLADFGKKENKDYVEKETEVIISDIITYAKSIYSFLS